MDSLRQDLLYGARLLGKHRGFTAVAVLSIGLGIAANTTVFSVLNTLRFRPLPFEESDRLVQILEVNPQQGQGLRGPTWETFDAWRRQSQSFEGMGLVGASHTGVMSGKGGAERVRSEAFDVNLLAVLGVDPILGRHPVQEDMAGTFSTTALISHGLWQRRYGGRDDVIGTELTYNDLPRTIIGVMPEGFWLFPWSRDVELWTCLDLSGMPTSRFLTKVARLKPGVSIDQAQAELATISSRLEETQPDPEKGWVPSLEPLREAYLGFAQEAVYFLFGAVGFVLLIACTNIANLLLARGSARRKEFAIRASVGGGRVRLVRQLLTESVLLSVLGGALGLVLTVWGIQVFVSLAPQWFPLADEVGIDGTVLGFTIGISMLSGVLFGLVPALQISRVALVETLKEGGRGPGESARGSLRTILLVSETALAIVLLAGASLMMSGYLRHRNADLGYDPRNVLSFSFRLAGDRYYFDLPGGAHRITEQTEAFYTRLLERVRGIPGVESAGIVNWLPIGGYFPMPFVIEGQARVRPEDLPVAAFNEVNPELFEALKIPLLRGRLLSEQDNRSSPWVVVINQTLARRFFPDKDPLGQTIRLARRGPVREKDAEEERARIIVGVVKDVAYAAREEDPPPSVYTSYLQHPWEVPHGHYGVHVDKTVVVRTSLNPMSLAPTVRKVAEEVDPTQPPTEAVALEQQLVDSLASPRFMMQLVSLFAGLAVVLAAVGIYGVMSYFVTQRRRELAVRAALGAQKRDLTRLVVNGSLKVTLVGAVVGCLATLGLSRFLTAFMFGVESADLSFLLLVTVLMMLVGVVASYIPARRAAKIDPMTALRDE